MSYTKLHPDAPMYPHGIDQVPGITVRQYIALQIYIRACTNGIKGHTAEEIAHQSFINADIFIERANK